MRHLQLPTSKRWSAIGLGTWQFGSAEWGYGGDYAAGPDSEAARIVKRALELGITVFDTAEVYGFGRSERILGDALDRADADPATTVVASKVFPLLPIGPVVSQRGVASSVAPAPPARPLPGPPAQPADRRPPHDARHAHAAGRGRRRRGRRLELLARPLAGRRGRAGLARDLQPGAVQPRLAGPRAGAAALRRGGRARRHRLQPARPGPALGQVRRRAPAAEPRALAQPAVPARVAAPRRPADRHAARGRRRPRRDALAGGAGVDDPPPRGRRHPRRVVGGAAGEQLRRGRDRARPATSGPPSTRPPTGSPRSPGLSAAVGVGRDLLPFG